MYWTYNIWITFIDGEVQYFEDCNYENKHINGEFLRFFVIKQTGDIRILIPNHQIKKIKIETVSVDND